jgi:tetratricopeptide (TPR) repeat protein
MVMALALVCATWLALGPVVGNGFINLDDYDYVVQNPYVRTGLTSRNLQWAWTTFHSANWHPLTWLSLQWDAELSGPDQNDVLSPRGFHRTNLILHTINVVLLFLVLRRMTEAVWRSAAVAGLFGLHPLHVESVAWIAERKDVLSTCFWLLTMLAYAKYAERPSLPRYAAVVLTFALGLAAKPMLVTLPFVLLLLDYWPLGRVRSLAGTVGNGTDQASPRRVALYSLVLEKLPLVGLAAASCVLTLAAQTQGKLVTSLEELPFLIRLENAVVAYVRYLGMTIWPRDLAAYYPHPGATLPAWQVIGAALSLLSVSVGVIWTARRRPYLAVGWFWYLGTLVPVIGLVQVASQALADRYTYVPLIGLFLMATWGLPDLVSRWGYPQAALVPVVGIVLIACAIAARWQVGYWSNSVTLWKHTLAVTSQNYVAHSNLGAALLNQDKAAEAQKHFEAALRLRPDLPGMHNGVGAVLLAQHKTEEALSYFEKALTLDSHDAKTWTYLGMANLGLERIEEAVARFGTALEIDPKLLDAHLGLGLALMKQGKVEEAERQFREVLSIDPDQADAHRYLGAIVQQQGNLVEAIEHYGHAVRLKPRLLLYRASLAAALEDLAAAYAATGQMVDAGTTAEKALEFARSAQRPDLVERIQAKLRVYQRQR